MEENILKECWSSCVSVQQADVKENYQGSRRVLHNGEGVSSPRRHNFNAYVPSNIVSNHVRQKLIQLRKERNASTLIAGDFNTSFLEVDGSRRQKISEDRVELSIAINQLGRMDTHGLIHPTTDQTFF